jgi:hypothetical protein
METFASNEIMAQVDAGDGRYELDRRIKYIGSLLPKNGFRIN